MKNIEIIVKEIYPKISKVLDKNPNRFKQLMTRFIEKRTKELYDIAPCDRIPYGVDDIEDLLKTLDPLTEKEVLESLKKTYYYPMANFNPRAAKNPITIIILCIVRYFFIKKKQQELELASIYLSFSGDFYPSIHYGKFPVVQPSEYRHVMEYVVNHRLNNQFDLKKEGNIFEAIKSKCKTWLNTYDDKFKSFDDEDVVYLIQQLHDRIKLWLGNICTEYYDSYENREYLTYDSDNLSDSDYHLADSNSLKIERIVEKAMTKITSSSIDYKICTIAADNNVRIEEVKAIIESILNNREYIPLIKELIRLIVVNYFESGNDKDISDIEFISFSIQPKPNSKKISELRAKEIVETILSENSPAYIRRKSRISTKTSYHRSVLTYFTLIIYNTNK